MEITCRILVGEDIDLLANIMRAGLRRADAVIVIGRITDRRSVVLEALAQTTGRRISTDLPGVTGARLLGNPAQKDGQFGVLVHDRDGILVCLPDDRRELGAILEGDVLPYLQRIPFVDKVVRWDHVRKAGTHRTMLEPKVRSDLPLKPNQSITLASYAGQTDVRIRVEANSAAEADEELRTLVRAVESRLGRAVYGFGDDRLETVVLQSLAEKEVSLALAECTGGRRIGSSWQESDGKVTILNPEQCSTVQNYLVEQAETTGKLQTLMADIAQRLRHQYGTQLGLLVFNSVSKGGVRTLATLSSAEGDAHVEQSFGGHPEHIDDWSATLGLVQVRNWLLTQFRNS
jgi:nicotinamide-nucleotide amidase